MREKTDNTNSPAPKKIYQIDATTLGILWSDGKDAHYKVRFLRQKCPCANCIDEWTGAQRLDPDSIPEDIRPVNIKSVGLYALQIFWNDGHDSGLYSHDYLRKLADQCC